MVAGPGPDLTYLTGYDPPPLERLTALIVRPGAAPVLLVPELERPRALFAGAGLIADIATWPDGGDPYGVVSRIAGSPRSLAVSDRLWSSHLLGLQRALPGIEFESASALLSPLRAVKDAFEIELLGRAAHGADEAFARVVDEPFRGRTEAQIASSLAAHLLASGHDSVGFTIVGAGPNAASPHHAPGEREIQAGDLVVLDFGGSVQGYRSDITRTVSVGEPDDLSKEIFEVVRAAQQAGFDAAMPGTAAEEVDAAARQVIEDAGFGEAFFHRTGHGIGLEEHEEPYLVRGSGGALVPGNCFSIEPGVYLPGRLGVRIEDIVQLRAAGPERLNEAKRDLAVVG